MEDNFPKDDEPKDSPVNPNFGGKKIKLNDGSSQESLQDIASESGENEQNADSGVSADKSESTSSEGRAVATTEGPSNDVVSVGPSSSNIGAFLLDLRRTRRSRNYRKRRTPGRESDSDNSSRDSDDLSTEEAAQYSRAAASDGTATDCTNSSPSVSSSDTSSGSIESMAIEGDDQPATGDTDSEDDSWLWNRNENKSEPPAVLFKTRPKHTYVILRESYHEPASGRDDSIAHCWDNLCLSRDYSTSAISHTGEIINRELGLTFPRGKTIQDDVVFEQKFYGSLHAVYRLEKLHSLLKHRGCVNSINFHPEGRLLVSGSDDTNVVIWDWSRKVALQVTKTGHKSNVFQSKFLYLNVESQINIATCARDGQVRLLSLPPAGGAGGAGGAVRRLAGHTRAAHKLHVWPTDPHIVLSAGEDGLVMCSDVRSDRYFKLIHVKNAAAGSVPLYSVAGHPLRRHELLLAGRDKFVRVYDSRKPGAPLASYRPAHLGDKPNKEQAPKLRTMMHLTCAVYNHDGTEILGSYNDEDIYLFDAKKDIYDENASDDKDGYTHRFSGHCNSATFKGVAFFGPKSEYVVSGSDCSYIYMWEKNSEAIVQWMEGDKKGVVNCIETHPRFPVMATSGLDKDVKIWIPKRENDPTFEGLEKVVRDNSEPSPLFNDFLPTLYSTWHSGRPFGLADDDVPNYGGIEFDGNVCTAF